MEFSDCDRASERREVLLSGRCRKSSWNVHRVEVANISEGGCCLVASPITFTPGEPVSLRIAHLKAIAATIRWVRPDRVGVEFVSALGSSVIAELGSTFGINLSATIGNGHEPEAP